MGKHVLCFEVSLLNAGFVKANSTWQRFRFFRMKIWFRICWSFIVLITGSLKETTHCLFSEMYTLSTAIKLRFLCGSYSFKWSKTLFREGLRQTRFFYFRIKDGNFAKLCKLLYLRLNTLKRHRLLFRGLPTDERDIIRKTKIAVRLCLTKIKFILSLYIELMTEI